MYNNLNNMSKKKNKKKKTRENVKNKKVLKQLILDVFYENPIQTLNYKQIASLLMIKDTSSKQLIINVLNELTETERLKEERRGKYKLISRGGYVTGIVSMTPKGTAFIRTDEIDEDIFVSQSNLNRALDGDEVKVHLYARRKKYTHEGEVIEIVKRSRKTIVGTIEISKNFAFLIPDKKTIPYDIFIPVTKLKKAQNKQKVIARINEWPSKAKNPIGEIIEVLGNPGEHQVEIHAIMAEFELPFKFPAKVIKSAEKISDEITEEEIKKRRDFRNILTFTIDPADAKDFDDALSIQYFDDNTYEVGIHIADVTHYVKPNTTLEAEALKRATSVYLVDRVVPMLPERLSNQICSLRPDEEKLTFSAVFKLDAQGKVLKQWFGKTIIKSDKRFTYQEAQQIIENQEGTFATEINTLNQLAKKLRQKRFNAGAIAFDRVEPKFELDEKGNPLKVYFKISKDSNKLIEEFMLLANRKVAEFIGKPENDQRKPKTFVYRIHDLPDPDKLTNFANFIKRFGYSIDIESPQKTADSLNMLLENVKGRGEQNVVEQLAIRSMAKAEYSIDNIGHYGLSFQYYTHFTSPIRRYPDMMVHRLLQKYLADGKSAQKNIFAEKCKHSSKMERKASQAEWASIKYKQVEFMKDKIGDVFDGAISGVTEWGLYVELEENKIEGMIMIKDLGDDYYYFDEKNYCLTGQVTKNSYQLGNKLKVQIVRVNLERKQLDFMIYKGD